MKQTFRFLIKITEDKITRTLHQVMNINIKGK